MCWPRVRKVVTSISIGLLNIHVLLAKHMILRSEEKVATISKYYEIQLRVLVYYKAELYHSFLKK